MRQTDTQGWITRLQTLPVSCSVDSSTKVVQNHLQSASRKQKCCMFEMLNSSQSGSLLLIFFARLSWYATANWKYDDVQRISDTYLTKAVSSDTWCHFKATRHRNTETETDIKNWFYPEVGCCAVLSSLSVDTITHTNTSVHRNTDRHTHRHTHRGKQDDY